MECAKRTHTFYPVTLSDIRWIKDNQPENPTTEVIMKKAFSKFIELNMGIPQPIIHDMDISNISYLQEIAPDQITVEFSNI